MIYMSTNGVPDIGTPKLNPVEEVKLSEGSASGRTFKFEKASDSAKSLYQSWIKQPLQTVEQKLAKAFSNIKQVPETIVALFNRTQSPESKASSISIGSPILQAKNDSPEVLKQKFDQEMAKLDVEVEALDQELKIQTLESQYESAVIEDSSTGKTINLDQATGFYGRSVSDDKSKALLDATSYLSSTVKQKHKLTLSPEQQQALANKFFESQLSFYDIKGQVKTAADLQWLRKLAVSSPIQLLGNELSYKQSNLGIIATTLKHFIDNTDKLWAEKNKENPEDQFDAVKRNQFIASELEQQVSQLPRAIISAAFQKTTGQDSTQWRGVFDFATEKLSLSDELMETQAGKVLISLPTKLTTTLEKLAEVTARQLDKETPIALSESKYISDINSLTKAELSALKGIGIKKSYLEA
ncbi:hypothetical protein [Spartinivicinus poritis]|uniref:Uncharacterized protein n=1 Tax=Spartinivicinus poritis TaxID=2994640 RepID=A0ABT5U8J3_9GAMM|nr:hypothetical protein [Spartinivicinus sp. A2-2]MDE1461429.1 hypothetical protein [Spartinivicinus sp. A2-2]